MAVSDSRIVSIHQSAQAAKDGTFFAPSPAGFGRCGDNTVGHAAERKRLEPDTSRPAQGGEEQTFAPEQCGFDLADELNVEGDMRLERHDATRVHPQHFARAEVALVDRPTGVQKGPAIALQPLHDEAFTAE